jgi:DNA-binding NarL/FixJ family response regulator
MGIESNAVWGLQQSADTRTGLAVAVGAGRVIGVTPSRTRPTLTGCELEVLQLVAQGKASREIGVDPFISENTVKNHIRNILDKLGLHSCNEAVLFAVREDLISIS